MKPFNLERALAGDPVVTRDGIPVTDIQYLEGIGSHPYKVFADIDGEIQTFTETGAFVLGAESPLDLFMAPVKVEKWIVITESSGGEVWAHGSLFPTEAAAREFTKAFYGDWRVVKVEWEE